MSSSHQGWKCDFDCSYLSIFCRIGIFVPDVMGAWVESGCLRLHPDGWLDIIQDGVSKVRGRGDFVLADEVAGATCKTCLLRP